MKALSYEKDNLEGFLHHYQDNVAQKKFDMSSQTLSNRILVRNCDHSTISPTYHRFLLLYSVSTEPEPKRVGAQHMPPPRHVVSSLYSFQTPLHSQCTSNVDVVIPDQQSSCMSFKGMQVCSINCARTIPTCLSYTYYPRSTWHLSLMVTMTL